MVIMELMVTMKDIQRYKILTEVIENKLTTREASALLGMSYRHTLRLKHKLKLGGLEEILRKLPANPPNKKLNETTIDEILKLRRELYYDFNIMHFKDKYVDKASHFKTTRHGGLHVEVGPEQDDTQIERALDELNITLIPANSPQAKGRIEVTFRLFQDRLIKELRLAGIRNYEEANKFLVEKFLPYYNSKWAHKAESAYMPLPKEKNLDLIFCIKEQRTVNQDNTVSFRGQIIQIPPSAVKFSFAGTRITVCLLEDSRIFILYKGRIIAESTLAESNKAFRKEKKIERLLNKREYPIKKSVGSRKGHVPSPDHPWRKPFSSSPLLKRTRRIEIQTEVKEELEKMFKGMIQFV